MTCAKQRVICRIETECGDVVTGDNWCRNPQKVCPRAGYKTGEGYHLCRGACNQVGHAEQVAVMNLRGRKAVRAVLEGHSYVCDECKAALAQVGITEVSISGGEE